ncbi:MAG: DUF2062 domain-containing protein, partial [Francisellaceae bacterium]|nr:DUF2062 domain-containing protein [Francisellaceae bacterium]
LWHFNRVSVSRAFAIGLFFAWIPVPFQMLLAAGGAIILSANLPISIALVWLTNPITMPPLFYIAYKLGSIILDTPPSPFKFELSMEWLIRLFSHNWQPFAVGCSVLAFVSSIVGYCTIKVIWRYMTIKSWNERKLKRQKRKLERAKRKAERKASTH